MKRHAETIVLLTLLVFMLMLSCGCRMVPPKPQKGSAYTAKLQKVALVQAPDAPAVVPVGENPVLNFQQGENQETPSEQVYERTIDGTKVTETLRTSMGTTQHDKARDEWASVAAIEAKLRSAGSVKVFGFVLVLCALGMFYPPIRAVTGTTVQVATGVTGLGLIFGAQLLAGNETLVLLLTAGGIASFYFFRRHGYLQGMVDANKNGVPDYLE